MTNVIIPAKDGQNMIDKLLYSLDLQLNCDFDVTIVNDNPLNGDYSENIKKFPNLKIKELNYGENRGCGYARQFGVDNTEGDCIVFADCDDFLFDVLSLYNLSSPYESMEDVVCVTSPLIILKDKYVIFEKDSDIWLHGKSYKRSFIEKKHITFYPNSMGEDVGWNKQVYLNALSSEKQVHTLQYATYVWTDYNKTERLNTPRFGLYESKKGLVDNMIHVMKNAYYNNIKAETINYSMCMALFDLYAHYNLFLMDGGYSNEELDDFLKWCVPLYEAIKYNLPPIEVMEKYAFENLMKFYTKGYVFNGIKCSTIEFLDKLENFSAKKD